MRIRDWRYAFAVLLLCAAAECSWPATATVGSTILPVKDPATYRDLQGIAQQIANPTIANATISTATIKSVTVTSTTITTMTVTSSATIASLAATTMTVTSSGTIFNLTVTTLTVLSSATIQGLFTVSGATTIITSTTAFTNPLYAFTALASSSVASGTTFRACVSTLTITNPAAVNIPIEVHGFWDYGNSACANGATGLFWILEDGGFIGSENSTTPRWQERTIGSNDQLMSVSDILAGITPGTHNFCIGFDGNIPSCATFFMDETLTSSNWFIKTVQ